MFQQFNTRLLAFAALAGSAAAQEARLPLPAPAPAPLSSSAATVLHAGDVLPPAKTFNVRGADPIAEPADLDDSVPRAVNLQAQPGPHGDVVLARSEEDPDYLGFAGGRYYPSADERLDPELVAKAAQLSAAGEREVHGFVMFAARMTPARIAALENLGARVLGQHPYYCVKAALPISALDRIASLDFVRWVGTARANQKVHPNLGLAPIAEDGRIDVYIDLFESDLGPQSTSEPIGNVSISDPGQAHVVDDPSLLPRKVQSHGPMERALTALGVEITEYLDNLHAFRGRVLPSDVEALAARDFVQFVEPDIAPTLAHDESTPMIGNDIVRQATIGSGSNLIAIGHCDSGYDSGHGALSLYSWGWDYTGLGAFNDGCEHGTHTLGTILGNGYNSYWASLKGVAPGLARTSGQTRAYVSRIFDNSCFFVGPSLTSIMSVNRTGYWDGVFTSLKPVAINNSWGASGIGWVGSEADPRAVDDEVYYNDQLYVWAAGNQGAWGAQSILLQATAKNALTVGAVVDNYDPNSGFPSAIADFSSRGPCGDGRWKPNLVAPGSWITSCDANSGSGYRLDEGTSMAAPHVTGVAAELADWSTWLRYEPAALGSALMSSAETKSGVALTYPSDAHLRNYGTGRVEEHKAVLGSSDYYWNTWAFDAPWPNYQWADFNVPAGTVRMTVCMNYHEPSASAGASQALVNNWDLYIDDPVDGISGSGNAGNYFVQQSTIDNCEIRTIDNPTVGTWRWKAWPQNIALFSNVKMGVTVTFELDNAHCNPTFDLVQSATYVQPNQGVYVSAIAINYDGLASGVSLDSYNSGANLAQASGALYDGSYTNVLGNVAGGRQVELGDIPPYYGRQLDWLASWPTEGVKNFGVYCDIDNYNVGSSAWIYRQVDVTVDGTPPPLPTGFGSFTHSVGVWSQNPYIYMSWNVPTDNLSGIQGYSLAYGEGWLPDPGYSLSMGNVSTAAVTVASSPYGYYISMRDVDNANNWNGGYVWNGPYYVDAIAPTGPTSLHSTSHTVGGSSCDTTIDVAWNAALDYESYIAGYAIVWDSNPSTVVSSALNLPWYATSATSPALGLGTWYCHIRTQDNANNSGTTQHLGPFNIYPSAIIATYCTAKTNSLGCVPVVDWVGTPSATAPNGFVIRSTNVLNQKNGMLIYSLNGRSAVPFQGGLLCVHAPIRRTINVSSNGSALPANNCTGIYALDFNSFARGAYSVIPPPELSVAGTVIDAQWWGRDPGFAAPNNTSLSRGLEFVMCY